MSKTDGFHFFFDKFVNYQSKALDSNTKAKALVFFSFIIHH
ncbi:hypothetical protein BGP_2233 [Beggiatoa sp. PS]|nr:hypothetical protein BGP_2233 [Beggiatoa sp. PS]